MTIAYSGVGGNVTAGGTDMDVEGHAADVEQATFDKTTTADLGWQSMGFAIQKVSGSFDFFFNSSKNPVSAPQSMFNKTVVALVLQVGGGKALSGNAVITKLSFKSQVKDGIKLTASFDSDGAWMGPA